MACPSSSDEDCPSPVFPSLQQIGGRQSSSNENIPELIPDTPEHRAVPLIGGCGRNCYHCSENVVEQLMPPLFSQRRRSATSRSCAVRSDSPEDRSGRSGARGGSPPSSQSRSPSPSLLTGVPHHRVNRESLRFDTMMGSQTQREWDREERKKARECQASPPPVSPHTPSPSPPSWMLAGDAQDPYWDMDISLSPSCASPSDIPSPQPTPPNI